MSNSNFIMKFCGFLKSRNNRINNYNNSYSSCKDLSHEGSNWYVRLNEYTTCERLYGNTFNNLPVEVRKDLLMCGIPRKNL